MSRKLNAIIPDETWEALDKIASREMRTKSQMTAILLGEAIAEYWKRNPPPDELKDPTPAQTKPPATTNKTKAKRGSNSKSASN